MNPITDSPGVTNQEWEVRQALMAKPWAEATADEKIEKLRITLMGVEHSIRYINRNVARIESTTHKLKKHSHSEIGVVIPIGNDEFFGEGVMLEHKSALE